MQSDPIGLDGGINTYLYVAGNPATGFDIFGLDSRWSGSFETKTLSRVAGGTLATFKLMSECVNGKAEEIEVEALIPTVSAPLRITATK